MLDSIIVLAIVVLPGWLSLSVNQRYHPRLFDKSTVMSWGILLYHAMIVHLLGTVAFAVAVLIWRQYFLDTLGLDRIVTAGPIAFTKESPGTALATFGSYCLWMFAGSTASGITDLPHYVISKAGKLANLLGISPPPVTNDEPVWFQALNLDRDESNVQVYVRMKNGDVYVGDLESYPILPDSEDSKDIWLGDSIRYPGDNASSPVELDFSSYGGGGVLLNTKNISSIEYMFHDDYQWDDHTAAR